MTILNIFIGCVCK